MTPLMEVGGFVFEALWTLTNCTVVMLPMMKVTWEYACTYCIRVSDSGRSSVWSRRRRRVLDTFLELSFWWSSEQILNKWTLEAVADRTLQKVRLVDEIWGFGGCFSVPQLAGHTALDVARSKVSEYLDFQVQWIWCFCFFPGRRPRFYRKCSHPILGNWCAKATSKNWGCLTSPQVLVVKLEMIYVFGCTAVWAWAKT